MQQVKRIAVTPGEPAGIGPELMYHLAVRSFRHELVIIADPDLIAARMRIFPQGGDIKIRICDPAAPAQSSATGCLCVLPVPLGAPATPGVLNVQNAPYVLSCLDRAHEGLLRGEFAALVTGPVSKSIIDGSGLKFTGHTEYLQQKCGVSRVVMLLGCPTLKVALATTHLPLKEVSAAITPQLLTEVITILHHDLQSKFGIAKPKIFIAGLNPHAGEDGHLGHEEQEVIIPVIERLQQQGLDLIGPLPADTMFTPQYLAEADAFLTMYHDQGLPVLKYAGFDQGYNTTLGLPYIRTSVDHGTALALAGQGTADPGSLFSAVELAAEMIESAVNLQEEK